MAGEEEPDRVELASQPLGFRPWRGLRSQTARLGFAEQRVLARGLFDDPAVGHRQHRLDRREGDRPLFLQAIESARRGQAFQRLLVDMARIEPRGEIAERTKGAAPPRADQRLGLRLAHAFDRAQSVVDGRRAFGARAHVEINQRFH